MYGRYGYFIQYGSIIAELESGVIRWGNGPDEAQRCTVYRLLSLHWFTSFSHAYSYNLVTSWSKAMSCKLLPRLWFGLWDNYYITNATHLNPCIHHRPTTYKGNVSWNPSPPDPQRSLSTSFAHRTTPWTLFRSSMFDSMTSPPMLPVTSSRRLSKD